MKTFSNVFVDSFVTAKLEPEPNSTSYVHSNVPIGAAIARPAERNKNKTSIKSVRIRFLVTRARKWATRRIRATFPSTELEGRSVRLHDSYQHAIPPRNHRDASESSPRTATRLQTAGAVLC